MRLFPTVAHGAGGGETRSGAVAAVVAPPLIGRQEECEVLSHLFDAVTHHEAPLQVCLVHGDAGSGKTRCVRESGIRLMMVFVSPWYVGLLWQCRSACGGPAAKTLEQWQ